MNQYRCKRIEVSPSGLALIGLWCLALALGWYGAQSCAESWKPLLWRAAASTVRPIGTLTACAAPLVLTLVLAAGFGRNAVWILCPVRAWILGISAGAVGLCWGRQAPVMAPMLLFSALASAPVLLLLWIRILTAAPDTLRREIPILAALQLLIAAADQWIVSPFLVEVIYF